MYVWNTVKKPITTLMNLRSFSFFFSSFWCKSPPSSFQHVAATGMCPPSISPAFAKRQQPCWRNPISSHRLGLTILLSQHAALLAGTLFGQNSLSLSYHWGYHCFGIKNVGEIRACRITRSGALSSCRFLKGTTRGPSVWQCFVP